MRSVLTNPILRFAADVSAGTRAATKPTPMAMTAMLTNGIDLESNISLPSC
jgi:hypothetical protein